MRVVAAAPSRQVAFSASRAPPARSARVVCRAGSTFGHSFRVTTFGESHGGGVGCVVDGVPPRLRLSLSDVQADLDRRRPGQSRLTTPRNEADSAEILSGLSSDGVTLGTPICIVVRNQDQRSGDYAEMAQAFRPSHADATYDLKYGLRAVAGGGRASARETIGRVAAGAVAKRLLKEAFGTEVVAWVSRVHTVQLFDDAHVGGGAGPEAPLYSISTDDVTQAMVEASLVRCPHPAAARSMEAAIDAARRAADSCGGEVTCVVRGAPPGLGSPVFGKLEADLAAAVLSLPACKAFEVGSGAAGSRLRGSEHNDAFVPAAGRLRTLTNRSGGIQGGISNGEPVVVRAAFKPTATIGTPQQTVDRAGNAVTLKARGRHDPCVLPRAPPIVEAMVAIVLADHLLQHTGQCSILPPMA